MAKQKKTASKTTSVSKDSPTVSFAVGELKRQDVITNMANSVWGRSRFLPYGIIAVFAFLIYVNTLWNGYAMDDAVVLTENNYTKKGIAGIKDIFTHDAAVGLWGDLGNKFVAGGRYRPLSIATLAVEYEISRWWKGDTRTEINKQNIIIGENDPYLAPAFSHLINIILFIIACFLLYSVLNNVLPKKEQPFCFSLAFLAAMIFTAHPIHTEAVANIKGRDEILALLFSLMALQCSLWYVEKKNFYWLLLVFASFFLGLLSKENGITFLAIVPLTFYFFKHKTGEKTISYFVCFVALLVSVAVYLYLRSIYTDSAITGGTFHILNDPFAYTNGSAELQYATIVYTFLQYFKLLLFPVYLTHDYYYNQIPYRTFIDFGVIISLLVNVGLLIYALRKLSQKTIPSYAILFYFITFSIVSNVFFSVGVLMNERFMFFSSVGFSLLLAYWLLELKISRKIASGIFVVIILLYGARTFARNFDWKNDLILFTEDVKISSESTKIQAACGSLLTVEANKEPDSLKRHQLLGDAVSHLKKAVQIEPGHSNAWLLLGNTLYLYNNKQLDSVFYAFDQVLQSNDYYYYYYALYSRGCVEAENGMIPQAIAHFQEALNAKPNVFECEYRLAESFAKIQQFDSAFLWFDKALREENIPPATQANIYHRIGLIYGQQLGNLPKAIENFQAAIKLNPEEVIYYADLGTAYGLSRNYDNAIAVSLKFLELKPNDKQVMKNMVVYYKSKGDMVSANQYEVLLQQP